MASSSTAAEKSLLREITLLSRLIKQHKKQKSHVPPYNPPHHASNAQAFRRNNVHLSHQKRVYINPNLRTLHTDRKSSSIPTNTTPKLSKSTCTLPNATNLSKRPGMEQNPLQSVTNSVTVPKGPEFTVISKTKLVRNNSKMENATTVTKVVTPKVKDVIKAISSSSKSSGKKHKRKLSSSSISKIVASTPKRPSSITKKSPNGQVVCVSRTRFLRIPKTSIGKVIEASKKMSAPKPNVNLTPASKVAKAVVSKYRLNRTKGAYMSQFKIDRRLKKTPRVVKKVEKYSVKYVSAESKRTPTTTQSFRFGRQKLVMIQDHNWWQRFPVNRKSAVGRGKYTTTYLSPTSNYVKRLSTTGKPQAKTPMKVLNIGGILYRSSPMSLSRTTSDTNKLANFRDPKGHIVYVRGVKFYMDPTGKTLKKVQDPVTPTHGGLVKRIDLGGVTYLQRKPGVLVRTNVHQARSLVSQAVNRSIQVLTKRNRQMINQHCAFFYRFGSCSRHDKGTCPYIHDPKKIAVCQRFLQGLCSNADCKLSHETTKEKMPVCCFFLEGGCNKDNCPYLHVKVNSNADVCKEFVEGYCSAGDQCKKQHVFVCPSWAKNGECKKGLRCPFPHKMAQKRPRRSSKSRVKSIKPKRECLSSVSAAAKGQRYFEAEKPREAADFSEGEVGATASDSVEDKRKRLMRKVELMKQAWLQNQNPDVDSVPVGSSWFSEGVPSSSSQVPKFTKQPSYIPL